MNFEFKSVEEIQEQGSGDYGKFGKNSGATLSQFEYVEGEYGPSLNISFKVADGTYKKFINPVTKVFVKGLQGEAPATHPEYAKNKKEAEQRLTMYVNQIAEAITSQETVKEALTSAPPTDVIGYFKLMERVVKSNPQWESKPLDLFLQYQYSPRPGVNRTYLEVPKPDNLKNGALVFVVATLGLGWEENIDDRGLTYLKEGEKHPFKRSAYFMGSPYAKMTSTGETTNSSQASNQFNAPTTGTADTSATTGNNW